MGTVTISGTSFDIYGTLAAAVTYMKARVGATAWDAVGSTDRSKALVSGTRFLDRQNWQGQKTSGVQALEFPRTGLVDKDGNDVGSVAVPLLVEEANYEMALAILEDATIVENANSGTNTKRVKAGSAEVEFFRQTDGTKLPTIIQELIGLFLEGSGTSSDTGNLASGTGECSTFEDIDQWGRVRGFP